MARIVVALLLALLAWAQGGSMAGSLWEKSRIPVWDFTSPEWQIAVQETAENFNAVMPPRVPTLAYHAMGELPCSALPRYGRKGGITVCLDDTTNDADVQGMNRGNRAWSAKVRLPTSYESVEFRPWLVCHEMMHALTNIRDNYFAGNPESCVHGPRMSPGAFDIAYAQRAYARRDREERREERRERRTERQHR